MHRLRNWAALVTFVLYCSILVAMDAALLWRGVHAVGAALAALLMDVALAAFLTPPIFYTLFARQREGDAAREMLQTMEVLLGGVTFIGLLAETTFSMVMASKPHDTGTLWLVRSFFGCIPFVAITAGPFVVGAGFGVVYLCRHVWQRRGACALFWADACAAACCPRTTDHVELVECSADPESLCVHDAPD